jgi:hypothetical protein
VVHLAQQRLLVPGLLVEILQLGAHVVDLGRERVHLVAQPPLLIPNRCKLLTAQPDLFLQRCDGVLLGHRWTHHGEYGKRCKRAGAG